MKTGSGSALPKRSTLSSQLYLTVWAERARMSSSLEWRCAATLTARQYDALCGSSHAPRAWGNGRNSRPRRYFQVGITKPCAASPCQRCVMHFSRV
jgi:hypothetical protein